MMEDKKIIELYFDRDESALSETDKKYGRYCYSIAYNILSDHEDSRESVNDTYLGAWNTIPPKRPPILSTFLGRITRNIAFKRYREKAAAKRGGGVVAVSLDELSECIASSDTVEREFERQELTRIVDGFLRALPEEERNVFIRRYWYCDEISAIAKRYGATKGKIKMMLSRTRGKLANQLRKEAL